MISLISSLSLKLYLNSLVYHRNIFGSFSKVFGNLRTPSEFFGILGKCSETFVWPSLTREKLFLSREHKIHSYFASVHYVLHFVLKLRSETGSRLASNAALAKTFHSAVNKNTSNWATFIQIYALLFYLIQLCNIQTLTLLEPYLKPSTVLLRLNISFHAPTIKFKYMRWENQPFSNTNPSVKYILNFSTSSIRYDQLKWVY